MSQGQRSTIHDVAATAGVSIATVSNVVTGRRKVHPRTRDKVLDAVERVGYQPSRAGRSLRAGRSFSLGYRLARVPNNALDQFLHQTVTTAADAGLELVLLPERTDEDPLTPYRDIIERGGVDGFIVDQLQHLDDPRIPYLVEHGIPVACFGQVQPGLDVPWVDVDGAAGIRAAVAHLVEHGRKRIAFVGWPPGDRVGDERADGYRAALAAAGLGPPIEFEIPDGFSHGLRLVTELEELPDAIVCVTDAIALGVIAGLRDRGIRPGPDVAVTGFDDTPSATLSVPSLTSIRQPMDVVGAMLVERIVEVLNGRTAPPSLMLMPELVVRGSSDADGT